MNFLPTVRNHRRLHLLTHEAHDIFWDCFNDMANDNSSDCRDQEKKIQLLSRLTFSERLLESNRNLQLVRIVKIYRSEPGSSANNEMLFFEANLVYETKRSRLLP